MPEAWVDAALMQQVLTNLIANAIRYSSRAEQPRVSVFVYEAGDHLVYAIEDNGVGFDNFSKAVAEIGMYWILMNQTS